MNPAPAEALVAGLNAKEPTLLTLPGRARCPDELVAAVEAFEVGQRPAALASAAWLRERALDEPGSARSWVWVGRGRALGFFAISVGAGKLEPEQLTALRAGQRPMPAVLLVQAARGTGAKLPAGSVLRGALGVAERIERLAGVGALMLDPFDEETAQMWRRRGFVPVLDKPGQGRPARMWYPLGTS